VTVPLNTDVYQSPTGKQSDGDFRADIHGLMLTIVQFLASTGVSRAIRAQRVPLHQPVHEPQLPAGLRLLPVLSLPVVNSGVTYTRTPSVPTMTSS
jgi:hypothetical protein